MQAVALRIAGDKAVFYRVRILGTQDTLLDDTGSHYFYQCHIQGSVDFIFGRSRSLYQVNAKHHYLLKTSPYLSCTAKPIQKKDRYISSLSLGCFLYES